MGSFTSEKLDKVEMHKHGLRNRVQAIEARLGEMSHDVGERMGSMASEISSTASDYAEDGRDYVQEHPGRSVAIAAATGLVAGGLIAMALRRRH